MQSDSMTLPKLETKHLEVCPQKYFGFTRRQLTFLLTYGLYNIFRGGYILIGGPFYPPEAEKRGITTTVVGLVFAAFDFASFLTCLTYGKFFIPKIGPRRVLICSAFNTSICAILFGCLGYIENKTIFLTFSFLIRVIGGAGDAGFYPSAFTVFQFEFPQSVSTTIGLFEVCFGFGAVLGPIICGQLVDSIGYELTYITVGLCLLLSSILILFFSPKPNVKTTIETGKENGSEPPENLKYGLIELLKLPAIHYAIFNLFSSAFVIGFVTATLEPHLKQFNLSSFEVGAVFSSTIISYTICCPLWGLLSDKLGWNKLGIMASGSVLLVISFIVMGPLVFISKQSYLWTTLVGLLLEGIGGGSAIMLFFAFASDTAISKGFPKTTATYGMISSIFTLTFSLGNSVGPAISGALYDAAGFKNACLAVIGLCLLVLLFASVLHWRQRRKGADVSERLNEEIIN